MNLIQVYSIPLWESDFPSFEGEKKSFLDAAKEFQSKNESVNKNNIYGYQSPATLQQVEAFSSLFNYVCKVASKATTDLGLNLKDIHIGISSAWINNNYSRQCVNPYHSDFKLVDNAYNLFTGIFHLSCPDESGELSIYNPGINPLWPGCSDLYGKNQFTSEKITVNPVDGNIILFPSYLSYSVETNNHDKERISISFDIIAFRNPSSEN